MDRLQGILSRYAVSTTYEKLPGEVVREVKRRIIDSVGVALAAFTAEPVKIARGLAGEFGGALTARMMGTRARSSVDWATFVNGLMIRYHDFNDTYLGREPLHPSDLIAAAVAVGDAVGADGKSLIAAIAVGYEAGVNLCDAASLRARGWDHVNYLGIGSVLAAARLLGLDEGRTGHALAIYAVPHAAMRQTRVGELSHWKGAAAANASRNAVFAALLAARGFTGPDKPFEGEMGMIRQMLGGEFDYGPLERMEKGEAPRRILDTYIKPRPVEYHAQTAVEAAIGLRGELPSLDEVEEIRVLTHRAAYEIIVKDPEKWDPKTKETADHSLPWLVAAALVHGDVWLDSYTPERVRDPRVLGLLRRMRVEVDPDIDRLYPEAAANEVAIRLRDGRVLRRRVDYARGHPRNPMTDGEVEAKFRRLTAGLLTEEQQEAFLKGVWELEKVGLGEVLDAIVV